MAIDDREQNFEKALAQRLRRGTAAASSPANVHGVDGAVNAACPDAEILAAYHERLLSPGELIFWKAHIADCASCQELLAQLELTDAIPIAADEEVEVFAEASQQMVAAVRPQHPMIAMEGAAPQATVPAQPSKMKEFVPARKSYLRWIAPAGAIAAALLVWVIARENNSLRTFQSRSSRNEASTERRADSPPPQAVPRTVPPANEEAERDVVHQSLKTLPVTPKSGAYGYAKDKDTPSLSVPALNLPLQGRSIQHLPAPQKNGAMVGGVVDANQESSSLSGTDSAGALPKAESKQPASINQTVEVQSESADLVAAPPPIPAESRARSSAADAVAPLTAANTGQAVQNQAMGAAGPGFYDAKDLKKVSGSRARDSRLAAAPGKKILWYVGLSGTIEKSEDGGKTFSSQDSGVKMELTAASAPNDSVCWVVGRSGTILITTDGGAHWTSLVSPLQENIGSVTADDALHATISAVANGASFATSDGGKTWTRVTIQQSPH
jgi:photosynthesis system II assembly factor YCF48-like protein